MTRLIQHSSFDGFTYECFTSAVNAIASPFARSKLSSPSSKMRRPCVTSRFSRAWRVRLRVVARAGGEEQFVKLEAAFLIGREKSSAREAAIRVFDLLRC